MISILCYGDSNTYGYDPSTGLRYPENIRWTGVLQAELGSSFEVLEEGCNGRTGAYCDPLEPWLFGPSYIRTCFYTHKPIDIVLLMLGSNDLKKQFCADAKSIADGVGKIAEDIKCFAAEKEMKMPRIVLISPPEIEPGILDSLFGCDFDCSAVANSKEFAQEFKRVADELCCDFFDAAPVAKASELDSVHLTPQAHKKLGKALAEYLKNTVL